ncbi:hypothetical protein ABG79_01787 [Caloramator mitchellensis]|uniref:DUF1294 domain-containing protein n=1 Tax=Caloramator mitchellensis TaxID=908809 RepID=A0A0R3JSC6_CALMK|nr:DUF1294 domain-containing protein [Caloramator mitchellensis]KRQ86406.1 hypothetical protein ABG79_01787 [Caloramator mitchellensis]
MDIILLLLLAINIFALLIMFIDKRRAKKHKFRISEKTIFIIAAIGGSIGIYLGMFLFHHKTKHLKFIIGIPIIIVLQGFLIYYLR